MNNNIGYCAAKTEAEWQAINPILGLGEMVYSADTYGLKIGDGFTPWKLLPYVNKSMIIENEPISTLEEEVAVPMMLARTSALVDEPYIEINENRAMIVPDVLKNVALQYDDKVETVTFRCPRYWDDKDLLDQEGEIKIIFNHPNISESNNYDTSVAREDPSNEDYILFDWTISEKLTTRAGNISFGVNIEKPGENGWNWNTQICQNGFVVLPAYVDPDDANEGDLTPGEINRIEKVRVPKPNMQTLTGVEPVIMGLDPTQCAPNDLGYPEDASFKLYSIGQTYDENSANPQSGKAVAEAISNAQLKASNIIVDQTYRPASSNAQSGKAIANAIDNRLPKVTPKTFGAPFANVVMQKNPASQDSWANDDSLYFSEGTDNEDVSPQSYHIARRDSAGNLKSNTPINDLDCVNKAYVDTLNRYLNQYKDNSTTKNAYTNLIYFAKDNNSSTNDEKGAVRVTHDAVDSTIAVRSSTGQLNAKPINGLEKVIGSAAKTNPYQVVTAGNTYDMYQNIIGLINNISHSLVKPSGSGYYDFLRDDEGNVIIDVDTGAPKIYTVATSDNTYQLARGHAYLVQAHNKKSLKIVNNPTERTTIIAKDNGGISGFTALLIIVPKTASYAPKSEATGHGQEEYYWNVYCMGLGGTLDYDSKIFEVVETPGNTDKTLDVKLSQISITTTDNSNFDVWCI